MARDQVARHYSRRRSPTAVVRLAAMVMIWWLLLATATVQLLPAPVASAPKGGPGVPSGRTARVHLPGLSSLPIPVDRAAFDEAQRGFKEGDEEAIEYVFTAYVWIEGSHGQAVRVVTIDGEAVEVELLEGRYAGRRGWLKTRHLSP
jgi:hypothetical protein